MVRGHAEFFRTPAVGRALGLWPIRRAGGTPALSGLADGTDGRGAALLGDVGHDLVRKVLERGGEGGRGDLAEAADGGEAHGLRQLVDQFDVVRAALAELAPL